MTEQDVAKCQQLDIQLIKDEKSSDKTLEKIIQSESSFDKILKTEKVSEDIFRSNIFDFDDVKRLACASAIN